ncbi:MAG: hypothetical protein ABSA57_05575 [Candidatus Acidiferrales bacterium]|jgi:hypothetical protein
MSDSKAARWHWVSFLLCVLLGVVFTLPGSLSPASGLLGYPGDNFQHAWFLWHFARAVVKFQNPFYTNLIYYPSTVNLAWSTTDPLAGTLALPASLMLGPVVAYNLSLILQLALAAFFARLLCLRVCHNEVAALIGGICFGFSPFLMAHALGHLSLVTSFPIPLYFLALGRVLQNRGAAWKEARKDGLLLGLALLLTSLAHYNYTVLCLMATVAVIGIDTILMGPRLVERIWRPLAWASAIFLITFSPFLMMLVGNAADKPQPRPFDHIQEFSADALGFLIPSWNHLVFGNFARGLDPVIFKAGYEGTVYVGPVILVLAILGFRKGRDPQRRWTVLAAALAAIFYLLSLGPALRILGRQTRIPGPAALVYRIPWARFVSAPARFHVITALGLAVLSSLGVAFLLNRLQMTWQRYALAAGVSVLLLLDLLTIPFPVSSIADPAWSSASAAPARACTAASALQKGTVVTFPLIIKPYVIKSIWMQVSDGGRYALVDGYLSYTADRLWLDYYRNPVMRSLLSLQGVFHTPVDPQADRAAAPAAFRDLSASAFVVFDSPEQGAAVAYLSALLGEPGESAGSCTVFVVTAAR